ncbi:MAG: DNA primase [Gammaproteobacteria bacterium]|nr:DNA primase [Gammaproteobacteria bacterium]
MAGRIPQDFINDLLERVDIAEVIGARLELKRAGREFKALCPFHNEKTPSFHVIPDKGFYHCFGCGANGTALSFLLEQERMPFQEAIGYLAGLAGVEVPEEAAAAPRDERRGLLYDIVDRADRWFRLQLAQHPKRATAVDYLRKRGVDGQAAKTFGIGFAPPGRSGLLEALGTDDTQRALMLQAGLIGQADDGRFYDRFRDRIIFPIRDQRGRPIAFGGRILGDGQPKYLNSPESPLFHKGRELYGFWECRNAVRDPERVLLVEGYMDVVGLAQGGVPEACASLGTAATRDHLEKLFRLAPEVVFCFDGDAAGLRAAWKAARTALEVLEDGRGLRLLFLPDGEDPDTLIRKEGAEAFRARIASATPFSEYLFSELARELDLGSLDGRARLAHLARPMLERIPGRLVKTLMMRRLAELAQMPVADLERIYAHPAADAMAGAQDHASEREYPDPHWVPDERHGPVARPQTQRRRVRLSREDIATALLLRRTDFAEEVAEGDLDRLAALEAAGDRQGVRLLRALVAQLHAQPELPAAVLISAWLGTPEHDRLRQLITGAGLPAKELAEGERARLQFQEILAMLLAEASQQRQRELIAKIRAREASAEEHAEYFALKRASAGVGVASKPPPPV